MRLLRLGMTARRKAVLGLTAVGLATLYWLRAPSVVEVAMAHLTPLDTEFAPGYRDLNWIGLRHGMTGREVEVTIGPPLRRYEGLGHEVWTYSRSPGDTHYWKRQVHL